MTEPEELFKTSPHEARRRKAEQAGGARDALDGDIIMPDQPVEESEEETIARLYRLDPIEYDRVREAEAEALDIRMSTLDKMVAQARGDDGDDDSDLTLPDPEPWPAQRCSSTKPTRS